jgi:hypothetical protein
MSDGRGGDLFALGPSRLHSVSVGRFKRPIFAALRFSSPATRHRLPLRPMPLRSAGGETPTIPKTPANSSWTTSNSSSARTPARDRANALRLPPSHLPTFARCPRPAYAGLTLSTSRKRDSGSHLPPLFPDHHKSPKERVLLLMTQKDVFQPFPLPSLVDTHEIPRRTSYRRLSIYHRLRHG